MRIIGEKRLTDAGLPAWRKIFRDAKWTKINEVRETFKYVDPVKVKSGKTVTVFNAHGNNDRVITAIHYNTGVVFVLLVLDHEEYSKGRWKDNL